MVMKLTKFPIVLCKRTVNELLAKPLWLISCRNSPNLKGILAAQIVIIR